MATNALWEDVVRPITGFDGKSRVEVGYIGGTVDAPEYAGRGWLKVDIKRMSLHTIGQNQKAKARDGERVVEFYDDADQGSAISSYYRVTLSLAANAASGKDFSDGGLAGQFNYGYGRALGQLKETGTAKGVENSQGKTPTDSVELTSFVENAKAFDAVLKFFRDKEPALASWLDQLGGDDAAWRGGSADTFRELIDGVHLGYKNLATVLSSGPAAQQTKMSTTERQCAGSARSPGTSTHVRPASRTHRAVSSASSC
ncbi:AAWKG family protein, partial [Streptomyces sp. NPDC058953]|uniref:AAWKG family protein n=1 Tax=Streptomyces sp. NPDC058953 TaxID=3346676 RepID=UPI0036B5CE1B